MLLGQIIEVIAGLSYQKFVKEEILNLYHSHEGGNDQGSNKFKLRNNVMQEGAALNTMRQYGGNRSMHNIAAHGGWVASAVDLVRFASSFDIPRKCPFLSARYVNKLFAQHRFGDTGNLMNYGIIIIRI